MIPDYKIFKRTAALVLIATFIFAFQPRAQQIVLEPDALITTSTLSTIVLANGTSLVNNSVNPKLEGTVIFDGPFHFDLSGERYTEFQHLVVNNDAILNLFTDIKVDSSVLLSRGIINLADHNLTILSNGKIKGSFSENAMIAACGNGKLTFHINGSGNYLFPVGDITDFNDYSPAVLNFTKGKFQDAIVSVNVKNQQHPSISKTSNYINRFWTVEHSGISDFLCDVYFTYVEDDIIGNKEFMYGGKFTGTSWKPLNKITSDLISGTVFDFSVFTGGRFTEMDIGNSMEDYVDLIIGDNSLFINGYGEISLYRLEIINTLGQTIISKDLSGSASHTISLNSQKGLFLLKITGEKGIMTKKVIYK